MTAARIARAGAVAALLLGAGATGACKMSPAMQARNEARASADAGGAPPMAVPPAPPGSATGWQPQFQPQSPSQGPAQGAPPMLPASTPPATAYGRGTFAPLPPTAPSGGNKTADRGDRNLGPTAIGQMAPEEAPPAPTGR